MDHIETSAAEGNLDAMFILEHWKLLSYEEGVRRTWLPNPETIQKTDVLFFECTQYDQVTRRCLCHGSRPNICRNYPWYGKPISDLIKAMLPDGCGYRNGKHSANVFASEEKVREIACRKVS